MDSWNGEYVCLSRYNFWVGKAKKGILEQNCPSEFECNRCTAKKMLSPFSCFLFLKHLTQFASLKFIFCSYNKSVGFFLGDFFVENFVF